MGTKGAVVCTDCDGAGEITGTPIQNGLALATVCSACNGKGVR